VAVYKAASSEIEQKILKKNTKIFKRGKMQRYMEKIIYVEKGEIK
jgi:CRP-like cAMP-binding protein